MGLIAISLAVETASLVEATFLLAIVCINLASIDGTASPFIDLIIVAICTTVVAMMRPEVVGWRLVILLYGHLSATAYVTLYGR